MHKQFINNFVHSYMKQELENKNYKLKFKVYYYFYFF